MDHSLGAVDLSPTSYYLQLQDHPIFSPGPFEQLDRGDFADGIIQPDASSNSHFPAPAQAPQSMDHSFSPEPIDFEQFNLEDLLGDEDEDSNGAQPDTDDPAPAEDTAAPMEIALARLEEEVAPQQVNGHQGELGINSLEANDTGLNLKKPEPCFGNIDLSTATEREIIDHFRPLMEHRKGKEELPSLNDDLAHLEPSKLPVNKQMYWATNMLDLDRKTHEGGCWKEAEFRGVSGPYGQKKGPFLALVRTLEFYDKDGTKTKWRMIECSKLGVSDGHLFLEAVLRIVYQPSTYDFNSNTMRISGEDEEDNQNKGCACTLHGDCLHHHQTVQNNQAPSPSGKRPRTDDHPKKTKLDVWQHFTRIYIKVPKETGSRNKNKKDGKKLVYAVCNYCDKVFKADSKQGTSHHGRHAESCLRKHSQPSSS